MNIDGNERAMSLKAQSSGFIEHGRLLSDRESIGNFEDASLWAALNDDAINVVDALEHVLGSGSISFDKVDGTANTNIAAITSTLATPVNASRFTAGDKLRASIYLSSTTDVASIRIKIGTDASNYMQCTVDDSGLVNGWNTINVDIALADFIATATSGNGIDWAAITFIEVAVLFDAQTNTLSGIRANYLEIVKA